MNKLQKKIGAGVLAFVVAFTAVAGTMDANVTKAENSIPLHAPNNIGDTVIWDCVYYGSYPQTEVTKAADSAVYNSLQNAVTWDSNGDMVIGEEKYHRIQKKDATSTASSYMWENDNVYHYYKYEPIKWRVLEVNEKEVYLVSDKILDVQKFNQKARAVSWEESTLRSWLNGHEATENTAKIDYSKTGFISTAFSSEEQEQLLISGEDKVKLLAESEVTGNDYGSYGFTFDEARNCQSSDYAKAMGATSDEQGFSNWWLATSGNTGLTARYVRANGTIYTKGYSIAYGGNGVRVAIHLICEEGQKYSYAGTVSSDGTEQTVTPIVTPYVTPVVTVTPDVPTKPVTLTDVPTETPAPTITPKPTTVPTTTVATATPKPITMVPTITQVPIASPEPSTTLIPTGISKPTAVPKPTGILEPTKTPTVKKGTIYKDKATKAVYKVTKVAGKVNGTVQYVKPTSNNVTAVTIPATVKIKGKTYKVTSIGSKALQKKKKLKKVVIGKNVSVIGKRAFYGCKKLKTITIKTKKLTNKKVGSKAFKGINKNAIIKVPKSKVKAYKSMLKKKGIGTEVKVKKI